MATYTAATYNFDLSTDANFRALHGDIDSKIRSLGGWTYVSQTGDSDPSAATAGSNNTYPSWRVYSTTSNATTWYLRLDFGHNSGPSFKYQIGTTVNGSGTLGGQLGTQTTVTASDTSTSRSLHISQATGRLMILMGVNIASSTSQGGMSVHASVDGSGAADGGMEAFSASSGVTHRAQALPASGSVTSQYLWWPAPFLSGNSWAISGATPLAFPQLLDAAGAHNPTPACFYYGRDDLTNNTSTTVSIYSSTRTYVVSLCDVSTALGQNARASWIYD